MVSVSSIQDCLSKHGLYKTTEDLPITTIVECSDGISSYSIMAEAIIPKMSIIVHSKKYVTVENEKKLVPILRTNKIMFTKINKQKTTDSCTFHIANNGSMAKKLIVQIDEIYEIMMNYDIDNPHGCGIHVYP